ncbi:MAG: cyclophilin-like fold protein [Christensenellaceae bacterium]
MAKKAIEIVINGQEIFEMSLCDQETAKAFASSLPLTLEMKELNGNEKYHYLNEDLPSAPSKVETVSCGDLMLYGSDCVVLFYKNFNTSYSYTKIGKVNHPEGLEQALGTGSATVLFQIKS